MATKKLMLSGMLAIAALVALTPAASANHDTVSCTADAVGWIITGTYYKLVWENTEWPGDVVKHATDYVSHPSYAPSYPGSLVACL